MAIRVVLLDENIFKSLLLACALENDGINVADTSNSFADVEKLMKKHKPDALIFSLDTHAIQAIIASEKARHINSDLGLVFLTNVPDIRLLGLSTKELPRGAQVIVRESVTQLHDLATAIKRSIQDLDVIETANKSMDSSSYTESTFALALQSLTAVQIETLRLVAMGNSNAEIARLRLVTEKAVEHTITRMLQALKIAANPRHNARILLSREYFRFVEVDNQSPKLVS